METQKISSVSVTIGNGTSLSPAIDLDRCSLVGLQLPSGWTAAAITFQASGDDGATYADLYDESAEVNLSSPAASRYLILSPAKFAGIRFLKIRSGTSGSPVNQGADRSILVMKRSV